MIVKVQGGGGGTYANTGTSEGVINYLQHEDFKRMQEGRKIEHFFSHAEDRVNPQNRHQPQGIESKGSQVLCDNRCAIGKGTCPNGGNKAGTGGSHEELYPQGSDAEICRRLQKRYKGR